MRIGPGTYRPDTPARGLASCARGADNSPTIERASTNLLPRLLGGLLRPLRRAAGFERRPPLRILLERVGLLASPPEGSEYHAFISYSHEADAELARALERGLQRLAKPWFQPRALRIFRDESSLSNDSGLWSAITRGIESSKFLILLASEQGAKSKWCAREVAHWCSRKGSKNILIVLSDGEIKWDDEGGDFDWSLPTLALPPTLEGVFKAEPRYTDLCWARSSTDLSLSHAQFRDAIAELAAPLHDMRKDQIAGEAVVQHRRTMRIARAAAISLLLLTAAAVAGAVLALLARSDAIQQRRNAVSRVLASKAVSGLDTELEVGALAAVAAYREQPSPEAKSSLMQAVSRSGSVLAFLRLKRGEPALSGALGGQLLVVGDEKGLLVWDRTRTPPTPTRFGGLRARVGRVAVSDDGAMVAAVSAGQVSVWRANQPAGPFARPSGHAASVAFAPGSRRLAIGTTAGRVLLWTPQGFVSSVTVGRGAVTSVAFDPTGRELVAAGDDGLAKLRVEGGRLEGAPAWFRPRAALLDVGFGGDGVIVGEDGYRSAATWNMRLPAQPGRKLTGSTFAVAAAADGMIATGDNDGVIRLWRKSDGRLRPIARLSSGADRVSDLAFSRDASTLMAASWDGRIVLWRTHGSVLEDSVPAPSNLTAAGFVSRRMLVSAGDRVVVDDLERHDSGVLDGAPSGRLVLAVDPTRKSVAAVVADRRNVVYWPDVRRPSSHYSLRALTGAVVSLAFSPQGQLLAEGTSNGAVEVRSLPPARARPRSLRVDPKARVVAVSFDPTGALVAAGTTAGRVVVLDAGSGRLVATPRPAGEPVVALAFSRDGRRLAFGGWDRLVTVWDASTHRVHRLVGRATGTAITDVAFAPDGETLAWSEDKGRVVLWDVVHDRGLGEPLPGAGKVVAIDFQDDGRLLAVARAVGRAGKPEIAVFDDRLWNASRAADRVCELFGYLEADIRATESFGASGGLCGRG